MQWSNMDSWIQSQWQLLESCHVLHGRQIDECILYTLPFHDNSDYLLEFYVYEGQKEAAIKALPRKSPQTSTSFNFFWYRPYETLDFNDWQSMIQSALQLLFRFLHASSRIIQRKHFFFWTFTAEIKEGRSWEEVYSVGCLRRKKNSVPSFQNQKTEYLAFPIAPKSKRTTHEESGS